MSPRAADQHLQHVLDRLGVETRTAAAELALRVLGIGDGASWLRVGRLRV